MRRKTLKNWIAVCSGILCAELVFAGVLWYRQTGQELPWQTQTVATTASQQTQATEELLQTTPSWMETVEATGLPTTLPVETEPTETEPVETEPPVTEPKEKRYVLSFAGDCTLGSEPGQFAHDQSFVGVIGTDYDFPFRNVADYFRNDDFTIVNLESVLADSGYGANKLFVFRGPLEYTQILTGSSVEAVTLANNHTEDFGTTGYESTTQALTDAGVWYVEEDKTQLITTESGLTIGLYADSFYFSNQDIQKNVQALTDAGAEIIICSFHWGTEGSYRANGSQEGFAKAAIDAGADIVYGHHPHVLQRIEQYNDGIIFYSLGNFSFGGNIFPRDKDSAIIQQEVIRDAEGNVRLGEMTIIPVCISSIRDRNNFQPTPYEEGTEEYERTLSKLDGTFKGADLVVDYSHLKPTEAPTEAPTTPPAENEGSNEEAPPAENEGSNEEAPPAENEGSNEEAPPAENEGSNEEAPPAENEGSNEEAPPAENEGSNEEAPPAENQGSNEEAPPAENEGSNEEAPPAENQGSNEEAPPAEGGGENPEG